MKSKTPSKGRGLQEMKRAAHFFAHCAAAVKSIVVLAVCYGLLPPDAGSWLIRALYLEGA